jgi:alkylhydroperoxidase family enzyme
MPNAVEVIGRHPRLLWPWLSFWVPVHRRGGLSEEDVSLVLRRTARHTDLGARPREEPADLGERQRLLLAAVDELCAERMISDATWRALSEFYSDRQLSVLCFIVGNRATLSMVSNTFED